MIAAAIIHHAGLRVKTCQKRWASEPNPGAKVPAAHGKKKAARETRNIQAVAGRLIMGKRGSIGNLL